MAGCPYFTAILMTGLKEAQNSEVQLDYFKLDIVQTIVSYLYTGDINVKYGNEKSLLYASDLLQLTVLLNTIYSNSEYCRQHNLCVQCYDTITDKWTFKTTMPEQIHSTEGATATTVNEVSMW